MVVFMQDFKKFPFFLFFMFILPFSMQSIEYVYPVAALNQDNLLLIEQKAADNITLWFLDRKTKQLKPGLWSRFNPAGLRLLPDKSGFSFIDNGLVKVKFFHKRSPKTIALDEPLYDISMVQWIDNHRCYVSAKKNNRFGIFQLTIKGDVGCIVENSLADCLYPQKIDNLLFYIERSNNNYRMMSVSYPEGLLCNSDNFSDISDFDTQVEEIIDKQTRKEKKRGVTNKQLIFDFKRQPIAFLHMISSSEGFVLEYDAYVDIKDDIILFSYLHLTKTDNSWYYDQLFSFAIPSVLLLADSPTRLYESILPLLPRHINNTIYFADARHQKNLNIFRYDLGLGTTKQKTFTKSNNRHRFAPFVVNDKLFVGGIFVLEKFIMYIM